MWGGALSVRRGGESEEGDVEGEATYASLSVGGWEGEVGEEEGVREREGEKEGDGLAERASEGG